jgi:ABC-type branched-subunit amino acid transport system substrate-binding protein
MNFDASKMANGGDGFAVVGRFTSIDIVGEGLEFCDLSTNTIEGVPCQDVSYNTLDNTQPLSYPPFSTEGTPEVIKIGGLFSVFDSNGNPDPLQAQCLAAFLMAVKEVNANKNLLPQTKLVTGVIEGNGFSGMITAATSLMNYYFGGTGVDLVVSAGNDVETEISSQLFSQNKIIQIHTVAQAVELANGFLYSKRLQTTPLLSYQGRAILSLACYIGMERVTVFYLDNLFGKETLNQLSTGCGPKKRWTIVNSYAIDYGTTDFIGNGILQKAANDETRNFIIILDDPTTAGILMEQGYNFGLFVENTQIIGSNEITVTDLWQKMNPATVKTVMRGYLGVHYSPEQQILKSAAGQRFIKNFISQPDTQFEVNGPVTCSQNELDDSGLYFLYGKRSVDGTVCAGLQFSKFFKNGTNIYP